MVSGPKNVDNVVVYNSENFLAFPPELTVTES